MKIGPSTPPPAAAAPVQPAALSAQDTQATARSTQELSAPAHRAAGAAASPAGEGTRVEISAAAQMLSGTDGDFDADKVAALRQAIADGSYRVDAGAIADKLIANAIDVLGGGAKRG
ncbi:flagellar biosynthesis anti-sigma factor FlgM [Aquariibacter albus]|uniref:Negative regulator of flagellin synthesis n=1 Tax=Aquariibacter albus TaxID=2759899 RepID=A0A839HFD1_9BURK|nr:flagellar biosynthesis anti-sigma factor FlgM [Aquariibacter albus]MBB1160647.1 flagellar biosynthesis anti-sigma factor FlgM [Aquariibacter albus]